MTQDAIQGNSLMPENPESGQVVIQATQAARVPVFYPTEEVVRRFQVLNGILAQINTRLTRIEDRLTVFDNCLTRVDDSLSVVENSVAGLKISVQGMNNHVDQLTSALTENPR